MSNLGRERLRWLGAAAGITAFLFGCGVSSLSAQEKDRKLTISLADLPKLQYDPSTAPGPAKVYQVLMYDYLVGVKPNGQFDNAFGVAESWEYAADGKTWSAKIRSGLKFSDGSPLTIDDVVFSLKRVIDPKATSSGGSSLRAVISDIRKSDDSTLVIDLKQRYLFIPQLLSRLGATDGAIVSQSYFNRVGSAEFASKPMGSGPYKLNGTSTSVDLKFDRNDHHSRRNSYDKYANIVMYSTPEEQTRLAQVMRGEADIVGISAEAAARLKGNTTVKVAEQPGKANLSISYHEQWKPENPLSNPKVREALNLAINRQEIIETLLNGLGKSYGVPQLGPAHIGFDPSKFRPYEYNPQRAKALLAEAGYGAKPLELSVYKYNWPGAPELPLVMEAVAGYFQAVGVKVKIIQSEYNTVREQWGKFTLGASVSAMATDNRPVYPIELIWSAKGTLRFSQDPTLDQLIGAWAAATNLPDAESAIQKAAQYIRDENVGTSIVSLSTLYGLGKNVQPWSTLQSVLPFEMSLDGLLTGG